MSSENSVSQWLQDLQAGGDAAAQPLWERYFERLVRQARCKLRNAPRRVVDEEDVAISAFESFCRGAENGRFPQLNDRNDLWRLLLTITERKALKWAKHEWRKKRGGGQVRDEAALEDPASSTGGGLAQFQGREPAPDFAAQVAEECQNLLVKLDDAELKQIAMQKLEGCTNDEIAQQLGCVPRTVERKLRVIRSLWSQGDNDE